MLMLGRLCKVESHEYVCLLCGNIYVYMHFGNEWVIDEFMYESMNE